MKPFLILFLTLAMSAQGAISRTQNVSAATTNVAITSTTNGDMIVVFAYNAISTTIPSLPAGFTNIATGTGTAQGVRLGYKVSTGGDTTSGTWTTATDVICTVYSGAGGFGTTPTITIAGPGTSLTYSAVTLQTSSGSSWVLGFAGANLATAGMNGTPTGTAPNLGNRTNVTRANGCDTGTGVTGFTAQTLTFTTSSRTATVTIELKVPSVLNVGPGAFFNFF